MTLIQWFNPMTWSTSQVANILAFFSSAGTIGALWYAFHLERKNSKKINDLAIIAKELQRQNQLQAMQMKRNEHPNVGITGFGYMGGSSFGFRVLNYGKPLEVTKVINHNQKDLILQPVDVPFQLSIHQPFILCFTQTDKHQSIDNCHLYIQINVTDIYTNRYMLLVKGTSISTKIEIHEDKDEETAYSRLSL